jgi:hypothetical protein
MRVKTGQIFRRGKTYLRIAKTGTKYATVDRRLGHRGRYSLAAERVLMNDLAEWDFWRDAA